jgi:pilus assembly protein FimV
MSLRLDEGSLALNKRKVLDTARKHAQKGAKAKALKDYNILLKADPRDAKLLLEVGDAYRRWGQAEEAIAQYGKVAQQYRQDGFDARAVAVFKQILNLDPKHYAAYVSLSELYQRMGLDSEAISALQTAADGYHKEGRKAEALDLLRQTAALDPTNTTSRLKVAELLRQEGMEAEALSEYKAVAEELENQKSRDQLITVQQRILEIKPDEIDTLFALVRNLMTTGDLARAESFAVRALDASTEPAQYELLIEIYAQGGDDAKLGDVTRGLAKLYRDRGDEDKARELMQRLPAEDMPSSSRLAVDVSEVAEPELGDEELLGEEPFLDWSAESAAESGPESVSTTDDLDLVFDVDEAQLGDSIEPDALPEGEPDQLLAEANVYLRYGKRDQAISSLLGIIAQDPNHRAALEKLGEAYANDGQKAEAVEVWKRAAAQVREAGDGEALAVLKDRIAALDPAAAEQIGTIEVTTADAPEIALELDVEVDLDLDHAIDEVAASQTQSGLDFDTSGDDFEIELDDESMQFPTDADGTDSKTEPAPIEESAQVIEQTTPDLGDAADQSVEFELDVDDLADTPTGNTSEQSSMTASKVNEELEEAEFYLAQDMFDEAETILARVLELVPNHPSAMVYIGEIAAARGNAPRVDDAQEQSMPSPELTFGGSMNDLEVTERLGNDELDIDAVLDDDVDVNIDVNVDVNVDAAVEVDLEIDDDEDDDDTLTAAKSDNAIGTSVDPIEEESTSEDEAGESFDLREALADVLADDETPSNGDSSSGVLSTVEDGFGSIFSDFKKGVSETLGDGNYETRYDLGIAYREMGLYEDAIGEFRVCLESEARRFDSLYLMGICARELSRCDDAVNHFEQALALPEIPTARLVGVYFDLSLAQEGVGQIDRARASVQKVVELDENFPGARERLAAIEAGGTTSATLGEPGESFESFDELFDVDDDEVGDVEMIEAVPAEAFESFGDVIEEAESVVEPEKALEAAEIEPEPEPDPDENAKSSSKNRRKKISFI